MRMRVKYPIFSVRNKVVVHLCTILFSLDIIWIKTEKKYFISLSFRIFSSLCFCKTATKRKCLQKIHFYFPAHCRIDRSINEVSYENDRYIISLSTGFRGSAEYNRTWFHDSRIIITIRTRIFFSPLVDTSFSWKQNCRITGTISANKNRHTSRTMLHLKFSKSWALSDN